MSDKVREFYELSLEERIALMSEPLSKKAAEECLQADREDAWLFARNLANDEEREPASDSDEN